MKLIGDLQRRRAERERQGLLRVRRTVEHWDGVSATVDGRAFISFASNDYLGLARDAKVAAAAAGAADLWGVGAGASHLICGHTGVHAALEAELAAWVAPCPGAQALLFSSGYLANLAILTTLAGRGDVVFADHLNHACLNDGALLSRARLVRYRHGDVAHLGQRMAATAAAGRVIATDGVFSMDGDVAPLPDLLALADAHDAWLVVDDAHGFGVLGRDGDAGRGSLAHFGLASERLVYMGTLGKAAGVAGAFVAAHPAVIGAVEQAARSYVYTTATPPLLAAALSASLAAIRQDAARHAHLAAVITRFRERMQGQPWRLLSSITPIQPLLVGASAKAVALAAALWQRGFWVPAIRPPTVPQGTARLRIALSAGHSLADVDALADALAALSADPELAP